MRGLVLQACATPAGPLGAEGGQHHCVRVCAVPPGRRGLLLSCLVMTTAQMGHSRAGAQAARPEDRPTAPCQAGVRAAPALCPGPSKARKGGTPRALPPASTRVRAQGVQGGGQEDDVRVGGPRGGGGGRAPTRSPPACVPPFPRLGWVRRPVGRAYPAPRQALCKSQVFGLQIGQRLGGGRVGLGSGRLGEQKCGNRRRPAT